MNTREIISSVLIISGILLAVIRLPGETSYVTSPGKVIELSVDPSTYLSPDQVARMVVNEDSNIQIIDLRPAEEYMKFNIPGSVNMPFDNFVNEGLARRLPPDNIKKIFYSNGDTEANMAFVISTASGNHNHFVLRGGLNSWFEQVMNSEFSGQKISARENAIFETRYRARKLFTEINSLPDSLKASMLIARKFDPKKLDGGCE